MATIFGGTIFFFENWVSYSDEVPGGSKISSKLLYLARFFEIQAFLCFAFLKKKSKNENGHLKWQANEIFVETWQG